MNRPFLVTKLDTFSNSRTEGDYVIKTVGISGKPSSALAKNPRRKIIARTPVSFDVWAGERESVYFLDTLECGHQIHSFPQVCYAGKKSHFCQECGDQLALKFSPVAVPSPKRKKAA